MNKTLTHSMKSYITIFLVGILVGCICRLTDYCPADTLWSFSSIQTLLGFWIITTSKFQLNNHSTNRCYMEANTTMQQRFFVTVFSSG